TWCKRYALQRFGTAGRPSPSRLTPDRRRERRSKKKRPWVRGGEGLPILAQPGVPLRRSNFRVPGETRRGGLAIACRGGQARRRFGSARTQRRKRGTPACAASG